MGDLRISGKISLWQVGKIGDVDVRKEGTPYYILDLGEVPSLNSQYHEGKSHP